MKFGVLPDGGNAQRKYARGGLVEPFRADVRLMNFNRGSFPTRYTTTPWQDSDILRLEKSSAFLRRITHQCGDKQHIYAHC
jgi:hypothetical protein